VRLTIHLPSAKVYNAWSCTFTPPYVFMAWLLIKHNFLLLLPWISPSGLFLSELIWNCESYRQSAGLSGRGISPSQRRYIHTTTQNTEETRRDPCFEWDSNTQSQCLSGRRNFCFRPLCLGDNITFIGQYALFYKPEGRGFDFR
jgi:hypothetical protein